MFQVVTEMTRLYHRLHAELLELLQMVNAYLQAHKSAAGTTAAV